MSDRDNLRELEARVLRGRGGGWLGYYDRTGKPLTDVMEWAEWMSPENFRKNRFVAMTMFYGTTISTVCLGLDHSFTDGPPVIFETMTFPGKRCWRYHTEAEARRGHRAVWWRMAGPHVIAAALSIQFILTMLWVMASV